MPSGGPDARTQLRRCCCRLRCCRTNSRTRGVAERRAGNCARFIDEAPNHREGYLEEPLRALSRQPGGIAYFIFDRQIEHTPNWRVMVRSDQPPIEAPSLRE